MSGFDALFDSCDMTGLAAHVAAGDVTPLELLETACARCDRVNGRIGAVVLRHDAVARSRTQAGLPDGPFRGVPFLLKDLSLEARDHPAHNGSRMLRNTRYPGDAELYRRLAAAGLNTFGRTAAPEGGIGPVTEAAVYGAPTRNPWDLSRTAGGSSGGAGAAVASGIVPGAHGSDGGGSVRIPACNCGLFGFKPTRARLPEGPYSGEGWAGMATDGFLTRSVRDQAALLDICAGGDLGAPYAAPPLGGTFRAAAEAGSAPLRVAVCPGRLDGTGIHPDCAQAVQEAAAVLAQMGHQIIDTPRLDVSTDAMMRAWCKIVACGTALWVDAAAHRRRSPGQSGDLEPLAQSAAAYGRSLTGPDYLAAVEAIHDYGRQMARAFSGFDILLTATMGEPPARIGRFAHAVWDDYLAYRLADDGVFPYSPFTAAFNATGQPAASVPLYWSADGLPIGVHLAARFGEDLALMGLCADLERARPWAHRRAPVWADG